MNCKCMVVGCGALGNEVLKNLVLMGIGHLVIVDFDVVEQGNLTRSILFRKTDVGERKVDVAKRMLLDINPDLDIQTIFGDIAYDVGLGTVRRMDIVIGCVDNRWARYCIQRLCHRAGKTWVDGGILDLTGTVKVFRPGESCYACSLSTEALADMQRRMPCSGVIRRREAAGHAPTTPIIASIIGAVQAQEAIRCIRREGRGENRRSQGQVAQDWVNTKRLNDQTTKRPNDQAAKRPNDLPRMFCYDGDSMTVMTPVLEAWDEDCALHGEWNTDEGEWLHVDAEMLDTPIARLVDSSIHRSFDSSIHRSTGASIRRAILLNEPFVDYIVSRKTNERYEVMLPAHKVEEFFTSHPLLNGMLMSDFYQHEYREIDSKFPYQELTLRALGVPEEEILRSPKPLPNPPQRGRGLYKTPKLPND